jgi:drug/metabolite transporter (DMT)-like permease
LEVALALISAVLFALGSVLQQKAGMDEPAEGANSSLLLRMARRPTWLAGITADGLGFVAQAAALGIGRLAVVQPLLITGVVFALPLSAWLGGHHVRRSDLAAAVVVVAAVIGFLTIASPSGGRREAPLDDWLVLAMVSAAVCLPLGLLGHRGPTRGRAAPFGTAAGILFALTAALTKAVADELHVGLLHVIGSWEIYALAGVGYASMTFNQLALNTGALASTIATSGAADPIASVAIGLTLFHESIHATAPQAGATIIALAAALLGMAVLARSEARPPPERVDTPATPR